MGIKNKMEQIIEEVLHGESREKRNAKNGLSGICIFNSGLLRIVASKESCSCTHLTLAAMCTPQRTKKTPTVEEFTKDTEKNFRKKIIAYLTNLVRSGDSVIVKGGMTFRTNADNSRTFTFRVYSLTSIPRIEVQPEGKLVSPQDIETLVGLLNQAAVPTMVIEALLYAKVHKGDVFLPLPSGKKSVFQSDISWNEITCAVTMVRRCLKKHAAGYYFQSVGEGKYSFFRTE